MRTQVRRRKIFFLRARTLSSSHSMCPGFLGTGIASNSEKSSRLTALTSSSVVLVGLHVCVRVCVCMRVPQRLVVILVQTRLQYHKADNKRQRQRHKEIRARRHGHTHTRMTVAKKEKEAETETETETRMLTYDIGTSVHGC